MSAPHDRTRDPKVQAALRLAREGTAYFARHLDLLSDGDFDAPSLLPDWGRRHVVAHVAFNARALTRLASWAATGVEQAMYESAEKRDAEIEEGASLRPAQLRELATTEATRLNEAWQDLSDDAWRAQVRTSQGKEIPATTTVWMRTREVWLHAVDLDNGADFTDFPTELLDHLIADVVSVWRSRQDSEAIPNFVLAPDDRPTRRAVGDADSSDALTLRGSAAALASWATGRGTTGVTSTDGSPVPTAPRWL